MGLPALKRDFETLFSQLMSMEDCERLEIYEGFVEKKMMPSGEHSDAQVAISRELGKHFQKKPPGDGTGGWWLKTETSVFYPRFERMFNHDIAGWRRERTPENPKGFPIKTFPNWVCEVSFSSWRKDSEVVPETLAAAGVEHYWIADVERQCLMAFELRNGKYALLKNYFRDSRAARIPPFEAVELDVNVLFGADADDDVPA